MTDKAIEINLFGACVVRSKRGPEFDLNGAKHRALFALLATAPLGRRTRAFLQDTLWGTSCYDSGRQSLRRALSDIKSIMGDTFNQVLVATNSDLTLDLSKVDFIGRPGSGEFLEGMDLKEDGFNRWLISMRLDPAQVHSLYSPSSQPPARPVLPVVAVLPARSGPGAQDFGILGDWLAEEISRSLSRSNVLSVISHLSARALASDVIDIASVMTKLGADYCIAGGIRSEGKTVIFDADFIDTRSGRILWTRRFAGSVEDFTSYEAPGIAHIVRTVGSTIADEAIRHTNGRELRSIDDQRLLIAGISLMHRQTLKDFARSRELISEVLARAPRAAEAHAWLGKWYVLSVFNGWSTDPKRDTQFAVDQTARALDIDPDSAFALTIDGFVHNNLLQRLDIAGSRYSEALRINPNEALCWLLKGMVHAFMDQADDAIIHVTRARKLSPLDPFGYFFDSLEASAQLSAGNYEAALSRAESSLDGNRRHISTLRAKITALYFLDRTQEARAAARELLRRQPSATVRAYRENHPACEYQLGKAVAQALEAAGIPKGD
jgi:TolB-like protein/tetratricopeptide (TPR) repeat protein